MNTHIHIFRVALVSAALGLYLCCGHAAAAADLDEAIRKVRMGVLVVETSPGASVRVEQLRHEFWFGAALSSHAFGDRMRPEERDQYLGAFLKNFNAAVTENALKWPAMEPRRGSVDYATVNAILAWTDQHGIPLRGHNVFWGVPNMVQPWLKSMTDDELRSTLQARAEDVASRYRGRFAEYDLNNEMLHGNYYRICFAHPAVEGILMWGFWEGANWIPVSSLYRRDWSPTPAATAYRDLVFKQWWTTWRGQADAQGRCEVPAFFGKHRVTAGGKEAVVELKRKEPNQHVSLKQP